MSSTDDASTLRKHSSSSIVYTLKEWIVEQRHAGYFGKQRHIRNMWGRRDRGHQCLGRSLLPVRNRYLTKTSPQCMSPFTHLAKSPESEKQNRMKKRVTCLQNFFCHLQRPKQNDNLEWRVYYILRRVTKRRLHKRKFRDVILSNRLLFLLL